jgi:hypothetical protein
VPNLRAIWFQLRSRPKTPVLAQMKQLGSDHHGYVFSDGLMEFSQGNSWDLMELN